MSGYLEKIVETDPYLVSKSGSIEPTVRLLDYDALSMEKVASEALEYSKHVKKEPGKTSILVLAMGASEYYGPNRNGDAFRESELIKHHHTFESNAHVFKSHVNKDPAKAIGKVIKSFYNHDMHRVEIIMQLDDALCPEIVQKVREQKDVAVSMGCRIKYDVCSICGNKAPTRAQYCTHLKYQMNDIYPDGRVVCADNPAPNFFDISVVYRPADKTGYMMKKVAFDGGVRERGESSAYLAEKAAGLTVIAKYLNKAADIDKTIEGVAVGLDHVETEELGEGEKNLAVKWLKTLAPKLVSSYHNLPDSTIDSLGPLNLAKSLEMLGDNGIMLMTPEFLDLMFMKLTGNKAPSGLANKLVSLQSDMLRVLSKHPEIAEAVSDMAGIPDIKIESIDAPSARVVLASQGHSYKQAAFQGSPNDLYKVAGITCLSTLVYAGKALNSSNKLAYLQSRAADVLNNHSGFIKSSSVKELGNINLFKTDPDKYFTRLGQALIHS